MVKTVEKDLGPITRGNTEAVQVTFKVDGSAKDIGQETWSLMIKEDRDDPDSEALATEVNQPGDHSDPANGETTFFLDPDQTDFTEDKEYDIQREFDDSNYDGGKAVQTIMEGEYKFNNDVRKEQAS